MKREGLGEGRWNALGFVEHSVLFVVFTIRKGRIRLISARRATRDERAIYWSGQIPT